MEASSTTVNITGTVPNDIQVVQPIATTHIETKHNHKPNYGRYVEGCAACHAKYPDGAPPAKASKKKDDEVARLKAELARAYSQPVKPSNDDATRQLAEIMLRREAKQVEKEEADHERKMLAREQDLKAAKEQEVQRLAREAACTHTKENGRSSIADQQIHNNGMVKPFCMRCGKVWPWRRPHHEQMPTSVEA